MVLSEWIQAVHFIGFHSTILCQLEAKCFCCYDPLNCFFRAQTSCRTIFRQLFFITLTNFYARALKVLWYSVCEWRFKVSFAVAHLTCNCWCPPFSSLLFFVCFFANKTQFTQCPMHMRWISEPCIVFWFSHCIWKHALHASSAGKLK